MDGSVRGAGSRAGWLIGGQWSSASARRLGDDDKLVKVAPLVQLVGDWDEFLGVPVTEDEIETLRRHEGAGGPLGRPESVARFENALSRVLRPLERKRKPEPASFMFPGSQTAAIAVAERASAFHVALCDLKSRDASRASGGLRQNGLRHYRIHVWALTSRRALPRSIA
jgi:hypothetical protein